MKPVLLSLEISIPLQSVSESVHLKPAPIEKPILQREKCGLVIIAYGVWFLSPSQPITAFCNLQWLKSQKNYAMCIT